MSRQRDVLPLLLPDYPRGKSDFSSLSRCVRRRLLRRGHADTWKNQAIDTINELSGCIVLDKQSPPSIGKGVRDALAHVDSAFNGFRLDSTVSREESLREILAKSGIYDTGSSVL